VDQPDPDAEILAGNVSSRSEDFPAVFQHDTLLEPVDCGGPLVDLDGHVIGINIARAGRTEAYALPADIVQAAIEPLKSGKLAPPLITIPASRPAAN
jgi:serine protease Do